MSESVVSPKVSLCVPVRNGERYIKQALDSCVTQSFQDFEIIVVDNDSTDNTEKYIKEMQDSDDRIIYLKNNKNVGLFGNFNKCLEYARGKYIKFLCADDVLHKKCLEVMVPYLDKDETLQLIVSARLFIDENGRTVSLSRYSAIEEKVPGTDVIKKCLFERNYIGEPSAVLFRADTVKRGFREDLLQMADMEMWFYILEKGEMLNVPEPICFIRKHSGQFTKENIKSGIFFDDYFNIFELYKNKFYLQYTSYDLLKRKLVLALYVWRSRKLLSKKIKQKILNQGSYSCFYYVMPFVSCILFFLSRIKYHMWSNGSDLKYFDIHSNV